MAVMVPTESDVRWRAYHEAQRKAAAEPVVPVFYPLSESVRFACGFDIGQASDPSALCVGGAAARPLAARAQLVGFLLAVAPTMRLWAAP